jgi:hypothetical protein
MNRGRCAPASRYRLVAPRILCTLWLIRCVRLLSGDRCINCFRCVESVEVSGDLVDPSCATDYNETVARRIRTGMEKSGPSCSWRQCAAPRSAPRIKLSDGLTCAKKHRPGERPHLIFPHARRPDRDLETVRRMTATLPLGATPFLTMPAMSPSVAVVRRPGGPGGQALPSASSSLTFLCQEMPDIWSRKLRGPSAAGRL